MNDMEFRAYRLSGIETREKENTGYFSGYASVFGNEDEYGTIVDKGAFKKTIKDNGGIFPILFFHNPTVPVGIGPFQEDSKGLLIEDGEIDQDVEAGRNVFSGMKRGYIDRLSIGFTRITEQLIKKIVHLKELKLWEASLITRNFAANELALVTDVRAVTAGIKRMNAALESGATLELQDALVDLRSLLEMTEARGATAFINLPLADRTRKWDASAAEKRVRAWAEAEDEPNAKYRRAFMWYDSDNADNFGAYKLLYTDVIGGQLKAVPRGIFAIAVVLQGGRGGVDIPAVDKAKVKKHCEKYYAKMRKEFDDDDIIAPWNRAIEASAWAWELLEEMRETNALLRGDGPPDGTPADEEPHLDNGPREHPDPLLEGFRQLGRSLHETLKETR